MRVGGNAKAREALGDLILNTEDLKTKYTSKSALSYREKLEKRAKENISKENDQKVSDSLIDLSQEPNKVVSKHSTLEDFNLFKSLNNNLDEDFDIFKPIVNNKNEQNSTEEADFDIFKPVNTNNNIIQNSTQESDNNLFPIKKQSSTLDDLFTFKPVISKQTLQSNDSFTPVNSKQSSALDDLFTFTPSHKQVNKSSSALDDLYSFKSSSLQEESPDDLYSFKPSQGSDTNHQNSLLDLYSVAPAEKQTPDNHLLDEDFDIFKPQPTANDDALFNQMTPTKKRTFKPNKARAHGSKLGARKVENTVFQQQAEQARQESKKDIPDDKPSLRLSYKPAERETNNVYEERLGMGNSKQEELRKEEEEDTFARDRFGNAKAISSDQYFGRNTQRVSSSSDQYFGKTQSSRPFSKKILNVASKGANKLQNMLAEMEARK
ncbi:hypothetical protein G6F56_011101 [Rhizopus delemar]|uniref:Uncharacterized protein n=1 Tax=Rhizopus stolonifer TaxID=4846 RepID=A0A367IL06_RHIST|nr:hypothetical protein G6F56_011101 [Rhizopus delemar]RCH78367.1 hypothetical protein CU098_000056 [Rhizopus stolonifer]